MQLNANVKEGAILGLLQKIQDEFNFPDIWQTAGEWPFQRLSLRLQRYAELDLHDV